MKCIECHTENSIRGWIKSKQLCMRCYERKKAKKRRNWSPKSCVDCGSLIKLAKTSAPRCKKCCAKNWYEKWKENKAFLPEYKFVAAKAVAKRRCRKWNINFDDYCKIIDKGCLYCGKDLWKDKGGSIDRKDNLFDYELDNSTGCCGICNRAKDTLTMKRFAQHVTTIFNNWASKIPNKEDPHATL